MSGGSLCEDSEMPSVQVEKVTVMIVRYRMLTEQTGNGCPPRLLVLRM